MTRETDPRSQDDMRNIKTHLAMLSKVLNIVLCVCVCAFFSIVKLTKNSSNIQVTFLVSVFQYPIALKRRAINEHMFICIFLWISIQKQMVLFNGMLFLQSYEMKWYLKAH